MICQQGAELVLYQAWLRIGGNSRQGSTCGASSKHIAQGDPQAGPDLFDLMIDVAEKGRPVNTHWLFLIPDSSCPVETLQDAMMFDHQRAV